MTSKTTAERMQVVRDRIVDMEAAIGRAYLAEDHEGIGYYVMHLKAYRSELEGLEEQARAEVEEGDHSYERCLSLLREAHGAFRAEEAVHNHRKRDHGAGSLAAKLSGKNMMKAWDRYAYKLELAGALFGVDVYELMDAVEGAS